MVEPSKSDPRQFFVDVARVYYNKSGDRQKVWSVDSGYGTPEILCAGVVLKNLDSYLATAVSLDADNKDNPRAWMVAFNVWLTLEKGGIVVVSSVK